MSHHRSLILERIIFIQVKDVSISEFKAKCSSLIERVRKTGRPICITRRGTVIAEIVPAQRPAQSGDWLGRMKGTAKIAGDIVSPIVDPQDFEVLRNGHD